MATYKLIQDIEAEDKLLGPLTLKQFIYAGVAALFLYLSFLSLSKHATFLLVIFLPIAGTAGFFAFPFGRDQPTEIWALAKIRFLLKPHRRIWDQSGIKELVTVTAPKQVETSYTNGLSQTEVSSRLKALADTIDSRGWAIKNVNVNLYSQPIPGVGANVANSDRLIAPSSLPQAVPNIDIQASDDILDEQNNPTAQHFEQMINASTQTHRQQIKDRLRQAVGGSQPATSPAPQGAQSAGPPNDYWFLSQPQVGHVPAGTVTFDSSVVAPGSDDSPPTDLSYVDEQALDEQLKARHVDPVTAYNEHIRTILPLSEQMASRQTAYQLPQAPVPPPQVTPPTNPAILNLASNNDLNVATLARQVNQKESEGTSSDEVVISLH